MSYAIRKQDCIDNHEKYVALLATKPDKRLAKMLNLVYLQSEIAEKKRNTESLELLDLWIHQIIQARIYKAENNIPDAPNEMELAIAGIETYVSKPENTQEEVNDSSNSEREYRPKPHYQKDNDDQLSLF